MYSSTYKAHAHLTEQPLHDIDDTNFLNIRLSSLDLERATATLDAARSSDSTAQFRGLGVFRINLAPQFRLPKMPKTAAFRSEIESSPEYSGQGSPGPPGLLRHIFRWPAPAQSLTRSLDSKHDKDGNSRGNTAALHRLQASNTSGSTPVGNSSLRLSDYGRGLVSIKRDFSSSSQGPGPRSPPH